MDNWICSSKRIFISRITGEEFVEGSFSNRGFRSVDAAVGGLSIEEDAIGVETKDGAIDFVALPNPDMPFAGDGVVEGGESGDFGEEGAGVGGEGAEEEVVDCC